MAGRAGGPLLCVGDMLADLTPRDEDLDHDASHSSSAHASSSPISLLSVFEKNYNELTTALTSSGHSWTSLTQKVCAALKAADKLVQTAEIEFEQLSNKVHDLEAVLQKGNAALSNFQDR